MNITNAKDKIGELIRLAERQYKYGGDETLEGDLIPGDVNFVQLKEEIFAVIDGIESQGPAV